MMEALQLSQSNSHQVTISIGSSQIQVYHLKKNHGPTNLAYHLKKNHGPINLASLHHLRLAIEPRKTPLSQSSHSSDFNLKPSNQHSYLHRF